MCVGIYSKINLITNVYNSLQPLYNVIIVGLLQKKKVLSLTAIVLRSLLFLDRDLFKETLWVFKANSL